MGKNKVAVVTGASSGIGRATAFAFARKGWTVCAGVRSQEKGNTLAGEARSISLELEPVVLDVTDDQSVAKAFSRVFSDYERVDALVNNAGIIGDGIFEETSSEDFRLVMETNFFGATRCIQAVLPSMRRNEGGHVINISSPVSGRIGVAAMGAYNASKSALEGFSQALAQEVISKGVYVSVVEPGVVKTEIFSKMKKANARSPYPHHRRIHGIYNTLLKQAPMPDEVGAAIVEIPTSEWKFRHLVGDDVPGIYSWRESMSDEEWILQGAQSGEEWSTSQSKAFQSQVSERDWWGN